MKSKILIALILVLFFTLWIAFSNHKEDICETTFNIEAFDYNYIEPVKGVIITADNPALSLKNSTADDGSFSFNSRLPPGTTFTLRFEKDGYIIRPQRVTFRQPEGKTSHYVELTAYSESEYKGLTYPNLVMVYPKNDSRTEKILVEKSTICEGMHYGSVMLTDGSIYKFSITEKSIWPRTVEYYNSVILDSLTEKTGDVPQGDLEKIKKYSKNTEKQWILTGNRLHDYYFYPRPLHPQPKDIYILDYIRDYSQADRNDSTYMLNSFYKEVRVHGDAGKRVNTDENSESLLKIIKKYIQ